MVVFKDTGVSNRKELEATVQLEGYNLITIAETWWDELHDCMAAINGYKNCSEGTSKEEGTLASMLKKKWIDSTEQSWKSSNEYVEGLWITN